MKLEEPVESVAHCLVDRPDKMSRVAKGSNSRSWLPRAWLGGCVVLASLAGFLAMASPQQAAEESHTRIEEAVRPIASFRVGDAVLADAAHGDGDTALGSQVDPATWRHLVLLCRKTDGSKANVELLRPLTWLKEQGAVSGGSVEISVPECGIEGQARVLSITDCPPLQSTPPGYRTVTGTFHHQATDVMDVLIEGDDEPIGTTPNHPFWSEDRQDYVQADSLKIGERLLGESGPVRVKSLSPRGSPEPVYNIEVQCDHNYRVADVAVLVHNGDGNGCKAPKPPAVSKSTAPRVRRTHVQALLDGNDVRVKSIREADALLKTALPNATKVTGAGPKKPDFSKFKGKQPDGMYHKDYQFDPKTGRIYGHSEGNRHAHEKHINIKLPDGKKVNILIDILTE